MNELCAKAGISQKWKTKDVANAMKRREVNYRKNEGNRKVKKNIRRKKNERKNHYHNSFAGRLIHTSIPYQNDMDFSSSCLYNIHISFYKDTD